MRKNILFISPWYPNLNNPTLGNFIVRQAQLIAEDHFVFFIGFTPSRAIAKSFEFEIIEETNFSGIHFYYHSKGPLSPMHYFKTLLKAKEIVLAQSIHFDLIHGQIIHRSGFALNFFSSNFNIPAVSSEHWSGYTAERNQSLSFFEKLNLKFANKSVSKLLPVTQHLGESMRNRGVKLDCETWYNVVDSELFFHEESKDYDFIHLSTLDANKRPLDILEAFYNVWKIHPTARMSLGGDGNIDPLIEAKKRLNIPSKNLDIHSAIPYSEAAARIRKSKCLVQFSHFENLPCTISEAMTAGLYIISSKVGGINEVINEPGIGICIDANQLEKLSQAMIDFISKKQVLESKSSTLFHPTRLKKQINSIYDELLIHN